ncbi:MAG TPA: hypothetical protein VLA33_01205 [Gemmatimonadota bacterium]|nr:hypothetical protein [Gemmatimonadota bacterium]
MTGTIWRLTWQIALRRRRLLTWNVLVPVLLLVPVVASGAAAAHRAVVVAVFVVFFGAYGSCIPLIRDGMSGWAEKVLLTGYGGRRWLIERTLASTAIDWMQLLPVNLVLVVLSDAPVGLLPAILGATALALLFANLLGVAVAALVRALGEAALGCAVLSLFALHAAGVFRTPTPGSWWVVLETWNPLRPLHDVWLDALGAGSAATPSPLFAAAALAALLGALAAAAPWLADRIARSAAD